MYLLLTHDVDWPLSGPGKPHILARQERFEEDIVQRVLSEGFNPYYGVPTMMEAEEDLGVRSTFFFRVQYENGDLVSEYEKIINELCRGGWEIGLHVNDGSSAPRILSEKKKLEKICHKPVIGSRIHYLRTTDGSYKELYQAGIKYDSSLVYSKDRLDTRNTGYRFFGDLCEFPITIMDAYLFAYMNQREETLVEFICKSIENLASQKVQLVTLLWHDCSVMMRGGRMYPVLLEKLVEKPNIEIVRAVDAFRSIV